MPHDNYIEDKPPSSYPHSPTASHRLICHLLLYVPDWPFCWIYTWMLLGTRTGMWSICIGIGWMMIELFGGVFRLEGRTTLSISLFLLWVLWDHVVLTARGWCDKKSMDVDSCFATIEKAPDRVTNNWDYHIKLFPTMNQFIFWKISSLKKVLFFVSRKRLKHLSNHPFTQSERACVMWITFKNPIKNIHIYRIIMK